MMPINILHWDRYYSNTCIINQPTQLSYAIFHCNDGQSTRPILGNNTVYIQSNNTTEIRACGLNETEFQNKYDVDRGTVIFLVHHLTL